MAGAQIKTPDQRLRVFISSTLGELADERRAAQAAVEQLRLTPVMFELGARPHPPRSLYRSYLAQSDVFVAVYWQRYGWIAPDMEISGLEDELVLSDGMPRLVYLKRPAPGMEPALRDMLARHFEAGDTASYRSFGTAEELHDLLLDDLAVLLTERFDGGQEGPAAPSGEAPAQAPALTPQHHLPAPTSAFFGRQAELSLLHGLLADESVRLITLTGPAGTGKTRLAIRALGGDMARFADGVVFVDLSAERAADSAFAALARAVGAGVATEDRPLDALTQELRHRQVLLVLDNFEQLTEAAVGVAELLEHCPSVKILVTSREALRVRGEHVLLVPPLSLPDAGQPGAEGDSEAVRLFCDRAAAVQPGFRLTDTNAAAIAAICRRLDGLPLAIELAAARVQLFDIDDLRSRLEDRLDVLGGGPRDLPKRQQTLRDAITWSYDLLDEDECTMFRLFAVFSGACLTDVEETARQVPELAGVDVIDALGSLVDKSLVGSVQGSDGVPRLSMLQTIRAYATEKLDAAPEFAASARHAHAVRYSEVALRLQDGLTHAARSGVLDALADELGNLRAAWDEWVARTDVARLNDLLAPLWGYYDARGDYRSAIELGRDLLDRLAATPDSPERRRDEFAVRMSVVRTELAVRGFTAEAEAMIRDALERAETAEDGRQRFPGLRSLAYLHVMRSDFDQTGAVARELMAIAEEEQDPLLLTEAHLLTGLSQSWLDGLPAALTHYEQAVTYAEATRSGYVDFRVGPHPGVVANVVTGLTQWLVGSVTTASVTMQRALDLAEGLDHPASLGYALHHAGVLDLWRQDLAGLAARAEALRVVAEAHNFPMWQALALVLDGMAKAASGDVEAGLARLEEGFGRYSELSTPPVFWPALLMMRASVLGLAGRTDEALVVIEEAESVLQDGDPMAPDVLLVHGDLLLAASPPDVSAAFSTFQRVVVLAEEHGIRMAHLQALTRLLDLQRGTPGEQAAAQALQQVLDGFTEGLDTPHLVAARQALAASRSR